MIVKEAENLENHPDPGYFSESGNIGVFYSSYKFYKTAMDTAVHTTYRHIDNQIQYCIYLVYAEAYCRILTFGRPDFREFLCEANFVSLWILFYIIGIRVIQYDRNY